MEKITINITKMYRSAIKFVTKFGDSQNRKETPGRVAVKSA